MTNQFGSDDFPPTALPLEEALRNFVPSELWQAYEQSVAHRETFPRRSVMYSEYIYGPDVRVANLKAAQCRIADATKKQAWQKILQYLCSQLLAGDLTAYVREAFPFGPVRPIPSDAWRSLRIVDLRSGRVKGPAIDLTGIRIDNHPPAPIELQVTPLPDQLAPAAPAFSASTDYGVVRFGELEFQFGMLQAAVVRQLHEASLTDDPWRHGKVLLYNAGANTRSISDLFRRHTDPSWQLLIDFRHTGRCRLQPYLPNNRSEA